MRPEGSLSETAFLRHGFHYVNVLVEGITRKIYIVDGHTSSQKIRMDQVNTMRPERSLSCSRISEIRLPLCECVHGRHNSQNIHIGGPHIISKDAYGSGEHNETRAKPLRKRISETRLPLCECVSGRHNPQNIHIGAPHILSKDAYGSGEHNEIRTKPLRNRISEIRLPLGVPVSGRHNSQNIHC